jgi:hypothetical protein
MRLRSPNADLGLDNPTEKKSKPAMSLRCCDEGFLSPPTLELFERLTTGLVPIAPSLKPLLRAPGPSPRYRASVPARPSK